MFLEPGTKAPALERLPRRSAPLCRRAIARRDERVLNSEMARSQRESALEQFHFEIALAAA
ncbi:hypothetical protein KL86DES1_20884 [uncultured Desulfovibrio sp.]|uniref:Uncharacterized protein n=1 Tax=uncultured Desulfovibrio sp. TaxID=167968 RepID=A0A212L5L5_9BACT|nr:hypothetical protein KL86DES1_20884 [uncultured Desulfovibrio sp.]VZH33790.1 conserved protein of unknown function [Desulfovibrio sp. 86]